MIIYYSIELIVELLKKFIIYLFSFFFFLSSYTLLLLY